MNFVGAQGMNNDGDTIVLVNPAKKVVQSITYSSADEGEMVAGE